MSSTKNHKKTNQGIDHSLLKRNREHKDDGMIWSKETPTQLGWYWWRRSKFNNKRPLQIIEDSELTGQLMTKRWVAILDRDPLTMSGEWAGPIPEPEEVEP